MDIARLAFGRAERWDALLPPPYVPIPGHAAPMSYPRRLDALKQFLTTPIQGANVVLVTHSGIASDAWGLAMEPGEALIFRAEARGGPLLVARVLPAGWTSAADAQRPR